MSNGDPTARPWRRPTPNRQATTMGFVRFMFVLGIFFGWAIDRVIAYV